LGNALSITKSEHQRRGAVLMSLRIQDRTARAPRVARTASLE